MKTLSTYDKKQNSTFIALELKSKVIFYKKNTYN